MDGERAIEKLNDIRCHVKETSAEEQALVMAINALKAQLSKEGTTYDLISRTETVEHLRRVLDVTVPITDYDSGYVDGVEFGVSTVSTMPTIQPQSTAGQLNDGARSTNLIDRQQAIDALDCISGVEEVLRSLPPAQPERKKGEWIEISSINHTYKCSECGRLLVNVADGRNNVSKHYPYCHCGADMRGGSNE